MAACVLKLGGSLLGAPELPHWLDAALAAGGCVLVPGGGLFADAVREGQRRLGFDDAVAHELALLAMAQCGLALCGLRPALVPARDPDAVRDALAAGRTPVWLPDPLALRAEADIAVGWDTTSDSLAAWLAARLGATRLGLVKSAPLPPAGTSPEAMAQAGLVDARLPALVARYGLALRLFGRSDHARFAATPEEPGR